MKKIELKGISRMIPQSISDDGLSRDIINLRYYNGAMRPVGSPTLTHDGGVYSLTESYIHHTTDGKDWVISHNTSDTKVYYTLLGDDNSLSMVTLNDHTLRFSAIGNVLVVFDETDEVIYYALYLLDSLTYRWIGVVRFPEMMSVSFSFSADVPVGVLSYDLTTTDSSQYDEVLAGLYLNLENTANQSGQFTGATSLVLAYELFDGSIVKHSAPIYLKCGKILTYKYGGPPVMFGLELYKNYIYLTFNPLTSEITNIINMYGDIIKSINVYMSSPIKYYDLKSSFIAANANGTEFPYINMSDIKKQIINSASYRLIQKFNINEIAGSSPYMIETGNITLIETKEPLPVDNFTHVNLYAKSDFVYNSRLFMGDIKNYLYAGYSAYNFVIPEPGVADVGAVYVVKFYVTLKDIDGIKVVLTPIDSLFVYYDALGNINFTMKEFYSYPDSRASSVQIVILKISTNEYYDGGTYTLIAHPVLNMSYLIWDGTIINETTFGSPITNNLPVVSNTTINRNRIQASETGNAFYYPAVNSYNVGSGEIVGMGSNTKNIETGQFGEYPLYAFTTDGIWALSISRDPSILIDSIKPASPEVCVNSKAILPNPYGVIFISKRGVMIISGMASARMDTVFENNFTSPLEDCPDYALICANKNIADVSGYLESVSYQNYLNNAVIGWNYVKEEIIISNPAYNYSYVYSFNSKSWFRISGSYSMFANQYPKMLGSKTVSSVNGLYDITEEDFSVESYIPVLIETYPIKLEIDLFKKIESLAVRGMFQSDTSKGSGLYLFGSIDGVQWKNMLSKEMSGNFMDIVSGRASYSIKQLIVVITGSISNSSYLTHLDIAHSLKFTGRVR